MGVHCLHPPLLLHLGSLVLEIENAPSSLGAGLAIDWRLLYFARAAVDSSPSCLVLRFVEGQGDWMTARLCLAEMMCALFLRCLVVFGLECCLPHPAALLPP